MSCHCTDLGLEDLFDADFADHDARRYLKKGLPARAALLLDLIAQNGPIPGTSSLEGGSGAGALTVELARRGVRQATGLDAMAPAVARAQQLAQETGVGARATFQVADFARLPAQLKADIVILDRVVCCYPDWTSLLHHAALASDHIIALSYPVDVWWARSGVRIMNLSQKLRRRKFRLHMHDPAALHAFLLQRTFSLQQRRHYWFWELAVFVR